MANSDVLVRMKADVSNYDANIAKARKQLDNFQKDNMSMGGILKQTSSTLLSTAAKFASFGAAVSGAMKLAKDAFFNSEQSLDEWGRTVAATEGVYKGFLNSINTGDISGFLSSINTITSAARDAYNALDELATFNAFNKANIAGARADLSGAIADFREGQGSKDAVKKASEELIKQLETRQKLQEEAYKKSVESIAAQRGVSGADLLKVMTGEYGTFKQLKDLQYTGSRKTVVGAGMYARQTIEAAPANERERLAQAVKNLNDTEIDTLQSIAESAKMTEVEVNNQRKMVARVLNAKEPGATTTTTKGGGGGHSRVEAVYAEDSIAYQEKLVQDLTKKWREAGAAVRSEYKAELDNAKRTLEQMQNPPQEIKKLYSEDWSKANMGEMNGSPFAIGKGLDTLPEHLAPLQQMNYELERMRGLLELAPNSEAYQQTLDAIIKKQKEIDDFTGAGTKTAKSWTEAARAVGMVGNALSSLQDPSAQIASTVAMAIANIAMAYSETLAKDKTNKSNIWYFIATAAAAMVSMATTISSIHSATGYAQGGIVDGNQYSGDNVPIMANSGELILNRAQQDAVASAMEGNGIGNLNLRGVLSGENIVIAADRYLKRSGQGELAVWK